MPIEILPQDRYVTIRFSRLGKCIGFPVLVALRHEGDVDVYGFCKGVLGRAPIAPSNHKRGYAVTSKVDEKGISTGGYLISPVDDIVFVRLSRTT